MPDLQSPSVYPSIRQAKILERIRLQQFCNITELAEAFSVSEETVRRDVRQLVEARLVRKVHGGVASMHDVMESPFQKRMAEHSEEKEQIAKCCAELIPDGASLMMDSGTTTSYVARALTKRTNLTVITNSMDIAGRLLNPQGNRVYIPGGEVRSDDGAIFGRSAVEYVRQFNVHWAVISVGAIDNQLNLSDYHPWESEFSRAVIEEAQEVIVVADRSKFGRVGLAKVCSLEAVDYLVTTSPLPPEITRRLKNLDVKLMTAPIGIGTD